MNARASATVNMGKHILSRCCNIFVVVQGSREWQPHAAQHGRAARMPVPGSHLKVSHGACARMLFGHVCSNGGAGGVGGGGGGRGPAQGVRISSYSTTLPRTVKGSVKLQR